MRWLRNTENIMFENKSMYEEDYEEETREEDDKAKDGNEQIGDICKHIIFPKPSDASNATQASR
jgi:hypothetical protein